MAGRGIGLPEMGGSFPGMDSDTLNDILKPYGVSEPSQLMAPGPFENMPSFGTAHPGLASRLDNALIAVSLMGPTGATAGENISNVARAALGVGPYRRQFAAQQQMLPIEMASKIGGLQAQQATMELHRKMGDYYEARGDNYDAALANKLSIAQMNMAAHGKNLRVGTNGIMQEEQLDPTTGTVVWKDRPELDVEEFKREQTRGSVHGALGGGAGAAIIATNLASKYGGIDKVKALLDNPTPGFTADLNAANRDYQKSLASYQGTQFRAGDIPVSDTYNKFMGAQEQTMKGYLYKGKDLDVKEERSRIAPAMLNAGADLPTVQKQAEANVAMRNQHNQKLTSAYGQYTSEMAGLPPEARMQTPFELYARHNGYDPDTRFWHPNAAPPPQQPQAGQQPAGSPMAGAPTQGGLSPNVKAILDTLSK